MAPTFTPDRQTFRALVADVAARAKARLPEAVNGRVESAAKLVLLHDVFPQEDGSILVGSSSDPLKSYHLVGDTCECQDWQHGKAPGGWCQHRIAAGIHKRVQEQLTAQPPTPPPVELPEDFEAFPDNDLPEVDEPAPVPAVPAPQPAPLPEAPSSANVRIQVHGYEVQVTLRDLDEQALLARLTTLLTCYPKPEAASPSQERGKDWCRIHNVPMKQTTKDGRSWYSHRTADGQWCKGR